VNGFINGENLLSGNFYFYFFSQKIGASESVNQEIKLVWPKDTLVTISYKAQFKSCFLLSFFSLRAHKQSYKFIQVVNILEI